MKATELRIGNFMGTHNKGEEDKVLIINAQNILTEAKSNKQGYSRYRPIPLTEEWFEKFDFDKTIVEEYPIFQKDFLTIEYYSDKSIVYFGGIDVARTTIQYVHQLQNLFYSIANEELTLTK
jgi:hypothetical protein